MVAKNTKNKSKNVLKSMKQANGRDESSKLREINKILGVRDETSKFENEDAYKQYLKEMDKADLQIHAVDSGVFPTENRTILIERLLRDFAEKSAKFRSASGRSQQPNERFSEKQIAEFEKLKF
jgi:hypothetical protein